MLLKQCVLGYLDAELGDMIFRCLHSQSPLYLINVKKLQFIHSVNGDGSKTAKIIKRQC